MSDDPAIRVGYRGTAARGSCSRCGSNAWLSRKGERFAVCAECAARGVLVTKFLVPLKVGGGGGRLDV
jgi:hypothetical protein